MFEPLEVVLPGAASCAGNPTCPVPCATRPKVGITAESALILLLLSIPASCPLGTASPWAVAALQGRAICVWMEFRPADMFVRVTRKRPTIRHEHCGESHLIVADSRDKSELRYRPTVRHECGPQLQGVMAERPVGGREHQLQLCMFCYLY